MKHLTLLLSRTSFRSQFQTLPRTRIVASYATMGHTVPPVRASPRRRVLLFTRPDSSPCQLNDKSLLKSQAYVNGKWVDAKSGKTFDVHGAYLIIAPFTQPIREWTSVTHAADRPLLAREDWQHARDGRL